ncbi:YfbM family protein [Methanimicrococcus sp. OttesenSCG-928-J09]|nr:YfbM family protein [Methanimicrococcus sp. OttesenSCG-928-J09]
MILIFTAVSKQNIRDFESGSIGEAEFINILVESERIGLSQIDRAAHVLANDDEFSEYYNIMGSGEILAGGDGEALIIDPISFEYEDDEDGGGFEVCDPAVYMTNEEVKNAAAILADVDENVFREAFDSKMKKLTKWSLLNRKKKALKESADDIFELLWKELDALKQFYEKMAADGNFVVVFSIYEDEDFE